MSVDAVTSRISEIRDQIAQLQSMRPAALQGDLRASSASSAVGATQFASALEQALSSPEVSGAERTSPEAEAVVAEARKYLGLPYVWGGTDPERGMDCSGLVQVVYKNLGHDLPRVSAQQATAGRAVPSMAQAQPGDLLAWDNSSRNVGVDHIAIYIGDGKMIEAPRTGLDIRIIDVPSTPDVIRRIVPDAPAAVPGVSSASTVSAASRSAGTGLPATRFDSLFVAAGTTHGVSPTLLSAVARQESAYDPGAVSSAGAQGLMQLMPATASGLGVSDSFDPAQAVDGAARLLADLLDRFGSTELALAAYNAGPGAVLRHDGIPPYAETQNYVRRITTAVEGAR